MSESLTRRVHAAQVMQAMAAPAHAIAGYQELLIEDVRGAGPDAALPDLERVLEAARTLVALVDRAVGAGAAVAVDAASKSALRHDLRTPMNGIIGYLEMVGDDFAGSLTHGMTADIERILAAARDLMGMIEAIVDGDINSPAADAPGSTMAHALARSIVTPNVTTVGGRARILVIDDVEANRDLLSRRLTRDDHDVVTVESARAALQILEQRSFDLALVDIMMPDMNGIELLERLKASETWRDISVIMVSGLSEDDAVVRCIALGAEDYLPKPINAILLRARISACLERRGWREQERRYLSQIEFEKQRGDALLDAILPSPVVKRLIDGEKGIVDRFECASIIFADIVGFTAMSAVRRPAEVLAYLDTLFTSFDDIADQCGVEKIKTIGDAYMAASGLPLARGDHAAVAVDFARAIQRKMRSLETGQPGLSLRIGVHSGPVIAGLIGRKRFVYDVWGHTVNLASRLEGHCTPGRILVSCDVLRALADEMPHGEICEIDVKGIGPVAVLHLD